MQLGHLIGIAGALGALILVEIRSAARIKNAADFDKGGGKSGIWLVCGALLGSLIGGQSTIGTAQLAYVYGLSGIWFTLGAALGCFALYIGYVIPLRKSHETTLMEVIANQFGRRAEYIGSILCSTGILVSVVSNIIAAAALMAAMTGSTMITGCIISMVLMCIYVVLGGAIGAGMGGIVKVILLYGMSLVSIAAVLILAGGIGQGSQIQLNVGDLFARDVGEEICNCLSLVLGVLSTQTYAQAIWSARSYHVARKAALISGILCIPIGLGGVIVGLYMRSEQLASPVEAFPLFLMEHLPPLVGGLGMGALLITVVTGGGGLTLGVSTIFVRDILGRIRPEYLIGRKHLIAMRSSIVMTLLLTGMTAMIIPGAIINDLGFLSMGLRGTVIFVPLTLALFFKNHFKEEAITVSMVMGPVGLIIATALKFEAEPLLVGVFASTFACMMGYKRPEKEVKVEQ